MRRYFVLYNFRENVYLDRSFAVEKHAIEAAQEMGAFDQGNMWTRVDEVNFADQRVTTVWTNAK